MLFYFFKFFKFCDILKFLKIRELQKSRWAKNRTVLGVDKKLAWAKIKKETSKHDNIIIITY